MTRRTTTFVTLSLAQLLGISGIAVSQDRPDVDRPTREVPREGCVTEVCHTRIKDKAVLHGPLNVNACDACHVLKSARLHAFELKTDAADLCRLCHELDLSNFDVLHEPAAEGACVSCHDPHGGADPSLIAPASQKDLCRTCHEDVLSSTQSFHGPAMAGTCSACHGAHGAEFPKLLHKQGHELCVSCHLAIEASITSSTFVHDPARFNCQLCHDPHATDQRMQLLDDPITLCGECHESIQHTVETATVEHAAVTSERSCLNCHDAHAADHPRMLRENAMNLCFECHDKEIELEGGRILKNVKAIIEGGTSLHGPTAESDCTACHDIHGGGHERLLRYEYPSELYYPFKEGAYALCFSCHDRQMVQEPLTTALTAFRNGEDNLHFVHVNKTEKGRTCGICHDAHAADRDHNIHDEIPFGPGGWMLPIHFEQTEHGGKCAAGCHRAYEYNRIDPETYPRPEPPDNQVPDGTPPELRNESDESQHPAGTALPSSPKSPLRVIPTGECP